MARDGEDGLQKLRELRPDVVTLDVEMPRVDGVEFLRQAMRDDPVPVVVVSSLAATGAAITLRCLELGAFDCLRKPSGAISLDIAAISEEIIRTVRAAAATDAARLRRSAVSTEAPAAKPAPVSSAPAGRARAASVVVAIASSTGGPAALGRVIPALPADLPAAVVVVQHLPPGFSAAMASRLDSRSAIRVREAVEGDDLEDAVALIAPAGRHMVVDSSGRVTFSDDPPLWGVRPAADALLAAVAASFGARAIAVVLTGMGRDGALGARAIVEAGGQGLAQDAATSVVFGMPRAALEARGADRPIPLDEIASAITRTVARAAGLPSRSAVLPQVHHIAA